MTTIRVKRGTIANIGTLAQGEPFYATDNGGLFVGNGVTNSRCTMDGDTSLVSKSWFLDEDDFSSNSATKVASQQSIKAYVDAQAGSGGGVSVNTETLSGHKTIADGDPSIQLLTPNGEHRNVLLPATPAKDCEFVIVNAGAYNITHYLEVKLDGDTNYFTRLYVSAGARFCYDSADGLWRCYGPGFQRTRTAANTYDLGNFTTAVGYAANGSNNGAAVGYQAIGNTNGAALGTSANGFNNGAAVGYQANGQTNGAAVGSGAIGNTNGAAVGYQANGNTKGVAVGYQANGQSDGVAVGYQANGSTNGVAIGENTSCNYKQFGSAIAERSQQQRYGGHARSGDHLTTNKQSVEEVQWKGSTTNATQTELFLHGVSSNRCTILASSVTGFTVRAVAISSTFEVYDVLIKGTIKRNNANVTTLITSVEELISDELALGAGAVVVQADDTNEALVVKVTGKASTTIQWGIQGVLLDRII